MDIKLNLDNLKNFIQANDLQAMQADVQKAHDALHNKTGAGNDFIGWLHLPSQIDDKFLNELTALAKKVQKQSDCGVNIGIGGSYLGIRATVEFIHPTQGVPLHYAGHNLSVDCLYRLLEELKNKKVTVVVISKSGTTTEPAVVFRIIKKFMEKKYSAKQLKERIICVTDAKKGALLKIAQKEGYQAFVIPDDVGGRFSVLTPVGLVPLAMAGVDIKKLVDGAREAEKFFADPSLEKNVAYQYAAARSLLYRKGKGIEVLSSFYDNVLFVGEWWKQLFGESEGKNGKGIFPASLSLTTDLHSMGQLMQDGVRNIFETFIDIEKSKYRVNIPKEKEDIDNFNCVAGKDIDYVNKQAYRATAMAHLEGGVPNMTISIPKADEYSLGQLYYFFEKAVAISGYLLEVNPFDQPGVEAYKTKMFGLLGRK